MVKLSDLNIKIALSLFVLLLAISANAVNYSTTANGNISAKQLWSDSLGNHPIDFSKSYDIFTIKTEHILQGAWTCQYSILLRVEGTWNNASGSIGSLYIADVGSVIQNEALNLHGNIIQNGRYSASCDSCSTNFSGNNDQYIISDLSVGFRNIKVNLDSNYKLHVKSNIVLAQNLIFEQQSQILIYPGFTFQVNGIITYPFLSDAFLLLADSTAYGSLIYNNGSINGRVISFVSGGILGTQPAVKHFVSTSVKNQTGAKLIDNTLGNYNVYYLKSGNWIRIFSKDTLTPAIGYYVAYNGHKMIEYQGELVNDSIKVELYENKNWTLIGNPYPCQIDGAAFLTEKQNMANLTGTIYLYEQSVYNNSDDYIMINLSGQLSKVKDNYPSSNIARSQGFWVENSSAIPSHCVFSNLMKTNGSALLYADKEENISRCFLGLENINGYFQKQLLAFTEKAGKFYDKLYDGYSADDSIKSPLSFYSLIDSNKYLFEIQGLKFNTDTTIIKLGYYSDVKGLHTISLEKLMFFPDSLIMYLYDNDSNTLTNLKKSSKYIFYSAAGRFNNRFKIIIVPDIPNSVENNIQSTYKWILNGKNLEINTESNKLIESIVVYNTFGQSILIKERINNPTCNINLSGCNGTIFIRALINGKPDIRKFVFAP